MHAHINKARKTNKKRATGKNSTSIYNKNSQQTINRGELHQLDIEATKILQITDT